MLYFYVFKQRGDAFAFMFCFVLLCFYWRKPRKCAALTYELRSGEPHFSYTVGKQQILSFTTSFESHRNGKHIKDKNHILYFFSSPPAPSFMYFLEILFKRCSHELLKWFWVSESLHFEKTQRRRTSWQRGDPIPNQAYSVSWAPKGRLASCSAVCNEWGGFQILDFFYRLMFM